jgi:beta-lactamase regulating signal transducer with metallopeptidase domain
MSDLGLVLAWSAIQVSPILLAAAALHLIASRRSPAFRAWVASMGLGIAMVVGLMSPGLRERAPEPAEVLVVRQASLTPAGRLTPSEGGPGAANTLAADRPRLALARLRAVWETLDRKVAEPAARCRPWGIALAVGFLAGAGGGLLWLLAGLWTVQLLRRRGRPVDNPDLRRLLADLLASMGCRRRVEVRETPELTAPATAGWRSPMILLPVDWRSWDSDERRAVLAHELAHVCRNDFLTGILAQAARALYFYHPLVHWLAGRLQLEQELAADALGAPFAGGQARYLRSLSRLALRQDGRFPCWPARAFLPSNGTLIRRIAMLRVEGKATDRPWAGLHRVLAATMLLAVAAGASMLHGPARADDPVGTAASGAQSTHRESTDAGSVLGSVEPFDLSYVVDDESQVVVAFRPAAAFRRSGMGLYRTTLNVWIAQQWAKAANTLKFDPTRPGQGPLNVDMFEQVTAGVRVYRTKGPAPNGRLASTTFTIRTTEAFDWAALLRLFKMNVVEVRKGERIYYRCKDTPLAPEVFFYRPDDRTVVFTGELLPAEAEKRLLERQRRETPPAPAFAQGKDWDQSLRGLLLVALDNRGGRLAKPIRGDGPPDDGISAILSLIERVDLWTLGLDDNDSIVFRGVGACPDGIASESTARAIGQLVDQALKQLETPKAEAAPRSAGQEKAYQMARTFLRTIRVEHEGQSILVRSAGPGTLADFASLVAGGDIGF